MAARAPAESVNPLIWTGSTLKVLDQRCLPEHVEYREYASSHEVAEAISSMQVRGAPAIGIAAAYGAALSVLERAKTGGSDWKDAVQSDLDELARSRPTAVNLFWALERIEKVLEDASWSDAPALTIREALDIHEQDRLANLKMGILGADLIEPNAGLLTHCNTGALATGGLGTALGVVRTAVSRSPRAVFATETRPWNQGARLTIWGTLAGSDSRDIDCRFCRLHADAQRTGRVGHRRGRPNYSEWGYSEQGWYLPACSGCKAARTQVHGRRSHFNHRLEHRERRGY